MDTRWSRIRAGYGWDLMIACSFPTHSWRAPNLWSSDNSRQSWAMPRVDVIIGMNPPLRDRRTSYDLRMYQVGLHTKLDLNRDMLRGVETTPVMVQRITTSSWRTPTNLAIWLWTSRSNYSVTIILGGRASWEVSESLVNKENNSPLCGGWRKMRLVK